MPATFVIPNADPWPIRTRGFPLGSQVRVVRSRQVRNTRSASLEFSVPFPWIYCALSQKTCLKRKLTKRHVVRPGPCWSGCVVFAAFSLASCNMPMYLSWLKCLFISLQYTVLFCAVLQLFFLPPISHPTHFVTLLLRHFAPVPPPIPYRTIPYRTIPYRITPYHTIPYHTIPFNAMPHHAMQYRTVYHAMPYHTMQYYTTANTHNPVSSHPIYSSTHFFPPCKNAQFRNTLRTARRTPTAC